MITRKSFIDALIAAVSWIVGYWVARILTQGMVASVAYAMIVAWWFTAHISSRFVLHISLIVPLFFGTLVLATVTEIIENFSFYKTASFLPFLTLLGTSFVLSFIICSPVIFDWLFRKIISICSRK